MPVSTKSYTNRLLISKNNLVEGPNNAKSNQTTTPFKAKEEMGSSRRMSFGNQHKLKVYQSAAFKVKDPQKLQKSSNAGERPPVAIKL